MNLPENLVTGIFVRRYNRFLCAIEVHGAITDAHLPNSGRMTELLVPGARVLLAPALPGRARKTGHDMVVIRYRNRWVGVDARMPSRLLVEAIREGRVAEFTGFDRIATESRWGGSRLDLLLSGPREPCYVEAKSVNLVEDGLALFPDAPTARGVKHVEDLIRLRREGYRAAVCFVIQRADAMRFRAHGERDPMFAGALARAARAGVEVLAYRCKVTAREITIGDCVPVIWD